MLKLILRRLISTQKAGKHLYYKTDKVTITSSSCQDRVKTNVDTVVIVYFLSCRRRIGGWQLHPKKGSPVYVTSSACIKSLLRINELGAYVFGHTNSFTPQKEQKRASFI